jgi:hypothetical protein
MPTKIACSRLPSSVCSNQFSPYSNNSFLAAPNFSSLELEIAQVAIISGKE